jgi:FkbH-like protein
MLSDADEYLKSLDMRMTVARFDRHHLARIAHLIQDSRAFNTTGSHYTEGDCAVLMDDSHVLPLFATMSDRLGDHGVIGIVVLSPQGEELVIRDWLMSCRVLERGVEEHLMNLMVEAAQSRGCTRVSAEYIRTAENGMVSELFGQFGFTMIGDDPDHTLWILPVSAYEPVPTWINTADAVRTP